MGKGFWGRILRVNLSNGNIGIDVCDEKFYRTYLGGRGIIAHYLLKGVPPRCDALGPDNIIVFALSVLTGTPTPGAARISVGAKSPLTGCYGEGEAGGHWGAKLKWAGYDGIVISGQSKKPVYLWINNGKAELRDGGDLWGLESYETQEAIRAELGDKRAAVAMIGPGGERLIRFACIAVGLHNYIGRGGLGAVMGAKNLKAIAVNGNRRPEVADEEVMKKITRWLSENAKSNPFEKLGTSVLVTRNNAAGGLPTRNFTEGSFDGSESISGQRMAETMVVDRWGCYACPVRCKRSVEVEEEGLEISRKFGAPEYEGIASFGSNCGINDIKVVAKANEICNRFTIDVISAGVMIAGAMEAAEKGLIPPELVGDLDLSFGSKAGMLGLLDQIVNRDGLGDILANGPKGLSERLGEEAASCFLHVKNQPLPLHDVRWKTGMGVGFALSPTGADHQHNIHDPMYSSEEAPTFSAARNMGILDPVETLKLGPAKARLWLYMTLLRSIPNSVLTCNFTSFSLDQMVDLVKAATGWNVSSWELVKCAERALNMARAFNTREGFRVEDDDLPKRFFTPLKGGALDGQSIDYQEFTETRNLTYDMLGWDRTTAAPKRWKLFELGLDWLVEDLERHGYIAD